MIISLLESFLEQLLDISGVFIFYSGNLKLKKVWLIYDCSPIQLNHMYHLERA